jgi:glycerol-3-phosphate dehydrogenase
MASPFSPEAREAALAALPAREVDLLVVGGGITGAGVARDAALRGLSVALVERTDWAAGTSSRSSKLIHGGVRYLQQGDVGLVREAAAERLVLRRIAPHLTTPLLVVYPTHGRAMHTKLGLGLWTFERLASVPADERHAMWDRDETLAREPTLDPAGLYGAATFTEYLTDDARLVLATVTGAHEAGAVCVNHAAVTALASSGAHTEVAVKDAFSRRSVVVRARVVVNAAGPWVDSVRTLEGPLTGVRLHLTRGIHLVVRHERLPVRHLVIMQARDRRSVFAAPRDGYTYLGTTDTDYGGPTDHPEVTGEDTDYLLEAANRTFAGPPLERGDVVAAWAGLRPLLHEEGKRPSEISRRDEIIASGDVGLISIAGGKLTTHRKMAERAVDLVVKRLGRKAGPCRTDQVPLPGGEFSPAELVVLAADLRRRLPALPPGGSERLVRSYGAAAERIAARAEARPEAATPLPGRAGVLRAEAEHALDEEMALTLTDVLERRLRLLLFDARQGLDELEAVAEVAAARLKWNAARVAAEVEAYRRLAASLKSFA